MSLVNFSRRCDECVHKQVCSFKETYKSFNEQFEAMHLSLGDTEVGKFRSISWIEVDAKCKHFIYDDSKE